MFKLLGLTFYVFKQPFCLSFIKLNIHADVISSMRMPGVPVFSFSRSLAHFLFWTLCPVQYTGGAPGIITDFVCAVNIEVCT